MTKRTSNTKNEPVAKIRNCAGIEGLKALGGRIAANKTPPIAPPTCAQILTLPSEKRLRNKLAIIRTANVFPIC